ncbi:translocation/assembly module TamB domain-containing protein [Nitrosovibrio sp. Nv4]|uniref:translocation/assembly module TamB domain-containing protein n=1 Tax=Nitrosovibrio sp. Nv4 TaxID=1945880 RepID=UPI000BC8D806|nr:translocation/assembly module TamB domain-containing protein [Nitrosovibrio sp. Nv4]SOD42086.1 autotransporter secretion inner membrane protein TamB [Nitrosovibrio sp. Nv4]
MNQINGHQTKNSDRHKPWLRPVLLLAVLIIMVMGAGVWLATTNSGLRWLGSTVSQLSTGKISLEGLDGKLFGSIEADIVRFKSDDLLVVARNVQLNWQPDALKSRQLKIIALRAEDVEIVSPPSSTPASPPDNLELPLSLLVQKVDIEALRVLHEKGGTLVFAATDLAARLKSDGRMHELTELSASLEFGKLIASGRIEGVRPFDLHAEAKLAGVSIPVPSQTSGVSPETLEARISATITGNLEWLDVRLEGNGAGLMGKGEAQLQPYAPFIVAGLRLSVSGFDPHVFSPAAPKASLSLQADLHENDAGQLEGDMRAKNSAAAALDRGGLPLLEMRARPILSAELLQLDDLMLVAPGDGSISGNLAWQHKQGTVSADLLINRVNPAALDTRLRTANLNGKVRLSGDATSQQGTLSLHDRDRALHMDADVSRADNMLVLEKMQLRHGRSRLAGHAKLGLTGRRAFAFDGRLQHFDLSAFVQTPRTDLNATLKLAGELEPEAGDGAAGTVHFAMANSHVAEQPMSGNGRIEFAGLARAKGEVELRIGINQLIARGGFGSKGDQLRLELVAPALAQIGYGFSGALTAEAILESSSVNMGSSNFEWPDMTFNAQGDGLTLPGEHHLGSLAADGALHGDTVALMITAADYGTRAKKRLQSLKLEVEGQRSRHEVRVAARLDDNQNLTLRARGELNKPARQWHDAQWLGELSELSAAGRFPFHLTDAAPLEISSQRVSLGTTKFVVAGGEMQISSTEWTPQKWSTRGYFTGVGLRPGIDTPDGEEPVNEALRLGGKWDITAGAQLKGTLSVARESGDWVLPADPPLPLGLETLQLVARAVDGRFTGELKARGKRLGEANAGISVPVTKSAESAMHWTVLPDAALAGNVFVNMDDISWVGPALDTFDNNIRSGGRLALEADVIGTFSAPRLKGRIRGDELTMALLEQGVRLEQGKLAASFDQESLNMDVLEFIAPHLPRPDDPLLKNVSLEKGPGRLRASGIMDFTGERGNLEITASLVPLAQRPDRWIIASGNGRASLENNVLTLRGSLHADAGLLAQPTAGHPQLADDVIVVTGRETADQQRPERRGLRIDTEAGLDLGEQFHIRASGLEGRLAGQLRLRAEPGQKLRATGTITARNTNFEAYGQRLVVERGIVNFQGPIDDPALNVLALRKGLPVVAGVEVTGSVRHPKVRLVSTPVVSDLEKLSWIALGRAPGGKADASLLLAAAGSILGGQSGGVTDKISQALGVDELSIRQAGSDALMGQVGTIGKRLSKRAYLSYEQGMTAVVGVTKLTYTLTPHITLVTRAGFDNAIDLLYTLRFD